MKIFVIITDNRYLAEFLMGDEIIIENNSVKDLDVKNSILKLLKNYSMEIPSLLEVYPIKDYFNSINNNFIETNLNYISFINIK
jgi:hypothetical protein